MTKSFTKNRILASIAALAASGCVPAGDGVSATDCPDPTKCEVYFPVGLALSKASDHLLVVNSDFDLQYSQGTVRSFSLKRIRELSPTPCGADVDCSDGTFCDVSNSEENGGKPSYFCVDPADARPCGVLGEKDSSGLAVAPGRCAAIQLGDPWDGGPSAITDAAEIAAFATQAMLTSRPCEGADGLYPCEPTDGADARIAQRDGLSTPERLFLPVRGDTTIHFLDVDESGELHCGRYQDGNKDADADTPLRCSPDFRVAQGTTYGLNANGDFVISPIEPPDPGELDEDEQEEKDDNPINDFRLPPEPIDLTSTRDGRVIVVSHQQNGRATTLLNNWRDKPAVIEILAGLPDSLIGVAALPTAYGSNDADSQFLVTSRSQPQVNLLRFDDDGLLAAGDAAASVEREKATTLFRPNLASIGSSRITTNSSGLHSRGLAIDDSARAEAVEACAGDAACESVAGETPLDVFVTNRSPNSLLLGRTGGSDLLAEVSELPRFYDNVPLTAGPTRVVMGHVMGKDGKKQLRAFVICFDDSLIYVYDPAHRRIESEIRTGRGPYSIVFDPELPNAYVGHFTDSYIGVISLDQRHPMTFGATLATLGLPQPPRASK